MSYELITSDDFDNLPENPISRFLLIEEICRRNLNRFFDEQSQEQYPSTTLHEDMLSDFIEIINSSASVLGIEGITIDRSNSNIERVYKELWSKLVGITTTLKLSRLNKEEVSLSMPTRNDILKTIQALRIEITNSDLAQNLKDKLFKKLNDLEIEVHSRRVNLSRLKEGCLYVLVALGSSTAFLANAPEAVKTIQSLTSIVLKVEEEVKEQEDEQKQLEDFTKSVPLLTADAATAAVHSKLNGSLDDEIPF